MRNGQFRAAIFWLILFFLIVVSAAWAQSASLEAPVGIPRDLARLRAQQLKDVRYQLSLHHHTQSGFRQRA